MFIVACIIIVVAWGGAAWADKTIAKDKEAKGMHPNGK
jgi:hypothetical protein